MKTLLFILTALIVLSCKAQSPVVAIDANYSSASNGTYFKDVNNELNKFEAVIFFNKAKFLSRKREKEQLKKTKSYLF